MQTPRDYSVSIYKGRLTVDGGLRAGGRNGTEGADHEVGEQLVVALVPLAHVLSEAGKFLGLGHERALVGRGGVEPGRRTAERPDGHRIASDGRPRESA